MDIQRAREIIRTLADGVDPTTGEILPADSVYNSPDVIRALFTVLEVSSPQNVPTQSPHRNAGKPWTDIEDEKLKDEFIANISIGDIAKEHGRTHSAIESRLEHLGLRKKPFWLFNRKSKKN